MSRRNQVTVEFKVVGDGLAALERAHKSFRSFGGLSAQFGGLSTSLARVNQVATGTGQAFTVAARSAGQFATQASGATSSLQRIGEIVAGSFGGNVLASVFTSAAAAAAGFARESVGAALSAESALVVLRTQSRLTGTDLAANIELAKKLAKEFRVSDTAGLGVVGQGQKFVSGAGKPEETLNFLRAVADLAAAAGRPMSQLQEITRQLASGDIGAEAALDKIAGGKNPSQIYDEFAKSIGTTGDKLDTAQKKLAIFNEIMAQAQKVQGVAAESLNTTQGRISTLSAAYENLQTRVGEAIVKSEAFKSVLELVEKAAAGASSPEFAKNIEGIGTALGRVAQGGALVIGTLALIGNAFRTVFDLAFAGMNYLTLAFTSLGKALGASITAGAATAIEGLQALLPESVLSAIGLGGIDAKALGGNARSTLAGISGEFSALTAATGKILSDDAARFKTILDTTEAAVRAFNGGGTADEILAASQGKTPGAADNRPGFQAKLRYTPLRTVIEFDGETIRSVSRRDGVIVDNTESNQALAGSVDALTGTVGLLLENPTLARVEVVAGKDTSIESVVPVGGSNLP